MFVVADCDQMVDQLGHGRDGSGVRVRPGRAQPHHHHDQHVPLHRNGGMQITGTLASLSNPTSLWLFVISCLVSQLYKGQGTVQAILVALAGISVPWMLVSKPLILYLRSQDEHHAPLNDASDVENQAVAGELPKAHKHEMSEIVIHQMIHTIEFVLGTVSNTASYLRLWALSLAHAGSFFVI
jgi:vacuolar-type H+-ATPase subunit I/STV1